MLVKSVLNSVPLYQMALFRAPLGVVKEMEKLMRNFIWGGQEGRRKISWVQRETFWMVGDWFLGMEE